MPTAIKRLAGMIVVFLSLLLSREVVLEEYVHTGGTPVLLPHRCTRQEELNRGDERQVFVRYQLDHSAFVNNEFMLVEGDLRRKIAGIMSTRQEQVIFFTADDRLSYQEVSEVLSNLREDDPSLVVVLVTKAQNATLERAPWIWTLEDCVSFPRT